MKENKISRRAMLRLLGMTATSALVAACVPAAGPGQAGGGSPAKALVEVSMVECWFGVPQIPEVMDAMAQVVSKRAQDSGLNVQFKSLVLDDHATKYPVLYASGEK